MGNYDYRWSLGTLIGLPLLVLLAVALLVAAVLFSVLLVKERRKSYSNDVGIIAGFGAACFLCFMLTVGGTAWGMYPYSAEYHQWQQTTGVVASVDSRLIAGESEGTGSTERFVVEFDDGRQRACDDTRCAQVEEGDFLELYCKRAYQWTGSHGYDCAFSELIKAEDR